MKVLRIVMGILLVVTFGCKSEEKAADELSLDGSAYVVTSQTGLNMREAAATDAEVIAAIPLGQEVHVLESTAAAETIGAHTAPWYKVRYRDKEGWVFGAFVEPASPPKEETVQKATAEAPREHTGSIHIRDLKEGDLVEGLRLSEKTFVPDEHFAISFDGEFTVYGTIVHDELAGGYGIAVDSTKSGITTEIDFDAFTLRFLNYLSLKNMDKLIASLSAPNREIINAAAPGEQVDIPVKLTAKNYYAAGQFYSSGTQSAVFLELLED